MIENYQPFERKSETAKTDMVPLMKEYLDKITQLCKKNGVSLILIKTPTTSEDMAKFYATKEYADKNKLTFLDYNEKTLYKKAGFCFSTDNCDSGHGNFQGAKKITKHIGKMLSEQYGLEKHTDEQWEETKQYYEELLKDCKLTHIINIDEYLQALKNKHYSIFISSKEENISSLKSSTRQKLMDLGMQEKEGSSYLAVFSNGKVFEQAGYNELKTNGTIEKKIVTYDIIRTNSLSSIVIDGVENSKNNRRINIVVYDNKTMKIIDSVSFDIFTEDNTLIR